MSGIFNPNIFNNTIFNVGGFIPPPPPVETTKSGTGGIDPAKKRRTIYKPTGLIDRPARTPVDARVDETQEIHAEVAKQLAKEFTEPEPVAIEFTPIDRMSQEQIDHEIGVLLRKKMQSEEEEMVMLIMTLAHL